MSAVASRTAAVSATTSRSLRLRAGSISPLMLALAGMPLAGPRGEQEHEPRVAHRAYLVRLLRVEVGNEAAGTGDRSSVLLELHLTGSHDPPRPPVDLVLLETLAGRQVDRDPARLGVASQHLRMAWLDVQRGDVPGLHARESNQRPAVRALRRRSRPPARAARPDSRTSASCSPVNGSVSMPASLGHPPPARPGQPPGPVRRRPLADREERQRRP